MISGTTLRGRGTLLSFLLLIAVCSRCECRFALVTSTTRRSDRYGELPFNVPLLSLFLCVTVTLFRALVALFSAWQ